MNPITLSRALIFSLILIAAPLEARFLQTDPVGYEDHINLYLYVNNDPLNRLDPDGNRDIYIGGAWDKRITGQVRDFATRQMRRFPDRDIRYFSYREWKSVINAASEPLKAGEPLNIIGHSLGGRNALGIADARAELQITNLITIDPVGSAGNANPQNVGTWTNVTSNPSDYNASDLIADVGRMAYGTTNTSGADTSHVSTASHGDFSTMMDEIDALEKIEESYKKDKKPY